MLKVALLLYPGARIFDVAVVTETWSARRVSIPPLDVELRRCAATTDPVPLTEGSTCQPDADLTWLRAADLVLVPGLADPALLPGAAHLAALREARANGATVASLCAGAFVLAASGLLDGAAATTHWALAERLAAEYPSVRVDAGALFLGQDRVWTSAGVAAGIDLSLHLVRELLGGTAATNVARSLVMAPHRAGGQAQFVQTPVPIATLDGQAFAAARMALERHPSRQWSVAELAETVRMSPRTFARRFRAETGTTPHRWMTEWRISEARRLLETGDTPVAVIAERLGFGSPVAFRQRFVAEQGVSPLAYRRGFGGDTSGMR